MLFLLVFSAIPLVHVSPSAEASEPGIMALDVCNASGSALYAGVDFPYLCESTDTFFPERFTVLRDVAESPLISSLFTSQLERPPRS
jgi:hypothetical protein